MNNYLVFDIGGTFIKYAVLTESAEMLLRGKIPTPKESLDELGQVLKNILLDVNKNYLIQGVAISAPGAFNNKTGVIEGWSSIPYIHGPNVKKILSELLGLEISIENDANCGALGELWIGKGKDIDNFVYVVLGTGIGGSIVINKKLYKGRTNQGGEFGYMVFDKKWYENGVRGIGEDASTIGLVQSFASRNNLSKDKVSGESIFELEKQGDKVAGEEINKFYKLNALLLINIQFALDPDKIILSGAVASQENFLNRIKEEISNIIKGNNSFRISPIVEVSDMPSDSNLYGALYNFLNNR